jgi:hypothetical protein
MIPRMAIPVTSNRQHIDHGEVTVVGVRGVIAAIEYSNSRRENQFASEAREAIRSAGADSVLTRTSRDEQPMIGPMVRHKSRCRRCTLEVEPGSLCAYVHHVCSRQRHLNRILILAC